MSHTKLALDQYLRKLRDEGFDVEILVNQLFVHNIPYVTPAKVVAYGTLAMPINMIGDKVGPPPDHTAKFIGECPCSIDGNQLVIVTGTGNEDFGNGLVSFHQMSGKPPEPDNNYYDKVIRYEHSLVAPANLISPYVTARSFAVKEMTADESVFNYADNGVTRAGLLEFSRRLELNKIAIIGLGGTGSYILDLVAKTPVKEIHLFDADVMLNHNAFRAPGAPTLEELRNPQLKVNYFASIYGRMHRGIKAHTEYITENNIELLDGINFVFFCFDDNLAKIKVISYLENHNIPFIDVGLQVLKKPRGLTGSLRVTTSTPQMREHFRRHVPLNESQVPNEYNENIQIADLNSLNAALAVIRWKRLMGYYVDQQGEHQSRYTIDGNVIGNEEF
ncbi:MAG: ThiF family adenylyltransferase [Bacteroidetes bacterium]|nr:ThiF family adenylyltransferase [Bacteroidota bacterium]